MKKMIMAMAVLMLMACSSTVYVPAWKDKGIRYMEDYKASFLAGKEDATEPHFHKAKKEIASGNDLSLLSTAYLTKYALHTASLESFETTEFARIYRLEAVPSNMAYCHFLKGNFRAVDLSLLPARYTGVVKAALAQDAAAASREITAIDDPLSRLIASGVWIRYRQPTEAILLAAIQTASAYGWRRPLWAYLEKLQAYYTDQQAPEKAQAIKLRLELLKK